MIEEKDTYTREEVKKILADLIESIGHDSAAVCHWEGLDSITVPAWRDALRNAMEEYHKYGKGIAYYKMTEFAKLCIKDD